jgi:PAS domain S-box-containing protein
MDLQNHSELRVAASRSLEGGYSAFRVFPWSVVVVAWNRIVTPQFLVQLVAAFLAYFIAGKLGQATTNIRSTNLGPVWPAQGVALAAILAFGYRAWPSIAAGALLVNLTGAVPTLAAAGQAVGATLSVVTAAFFLRHIPGFNPSLSRLGDALALIVVGAFGGALVSATIGISSLHAFGIQPYSGIASSWLIYWLGDSTGVLLVTPLLFTAPQLLQIRSRVRITRFVILLALVTTSCFVVFGDLPLIPVRLDALAFAVLPFVMWSAIDFGTAGASVSVFLIATIATLLTALGSGPFSVNTPFTNAVLLDVLFAVLAISGLSLAAVVSERKRADGHREALLREQIEMEPRLRLAAIAESSDDAITSETLDGTILSWNRGASRMFGLSEGQAIGQAVASVIDASLGGERQSIVQRLTAGATVVRFETTRVVADGRTIHLSSTISPLRDPDGGVVGLARIVRDVTDQKRAEEVLSAVNRRLIDAQEQERAKIGRELHDDIGQQLALLTWKLAEHSEELEKQASEIAENVQSLSRELHPARIEMLGLAAAVKALCREFAQQKKVQIGVETHDVPRDLPSNVSISLFRIAQEALHNAAKHSGVQEFNVRLSTAEHRIDLVVSDQGAGFDVEASKTTEGIGLITMRERVKLVGGELLVESQPGQGTTIRARVPRPYRV